MWACVSTTASIESAGTGKGAQLRSRSSFMSLEQAGVDEDRAARPPRRGSAIR